MRYRFGELELDTESHRLLRAGEPVHLWPKVFDLLRYLVERPGRLVTKQELLDEVWHDSHVSEGSVAWTISHARRAVGQESGDKQPIETVHKRGYRFTAEVRTPHAESLPPPPLREPEIAALPFVGRDAVMAQLDARVRAAREGKRGELCLLVGPPGIGKTRCMDELAAHAIAAGLDAWSARCVEDTWAPAFWPWVQVMREAARTRPGLAAQIEALLTRLQRAGDTEKTDESSGAMETTFWWFDGVSRLLAEAAAERPAVILFDDLQWADSATMDLLAFFAPELRRVPIVVVATRRDDAANAASAAAKRLTRHTYRIDLAPLTEDEVARYVRLVAASDVLRADTLEAMHRSTAGNPLFLEHTVQAWLARRGREPMASLRPASIEPAQIARDTLGASLDRLDPDTRGLVSIASVLGDRVGLSELQALSALDVDVLLARLEPALRAGFVVAEDPSTLRFCHALLRTVLHDELPAGQRMAFHRQAAETLEAADPTRLGEIAYHHYRSLGLGDHERVAVAAERAARAASRMQAFADAARFSKWALEAQALAGGVPPRARADLLLFHAQMLAGASDERAARERVTEAVALARAHGHFELLVRAARILRPTYLMGGIEDPFVRTILEEALAHAPDGSNDMRVSALSQLAWMPPYGLDTEKSKAMSAEALALAREIGDPTLLLRALTARLHALSGPDDCEELLAAAAEMLALDAPPRAWVAAAALGARYAVHIHRGDMPAAAAARAELGRLARANQWPAVIWFHDRLVAHDDLLGGDFEAAKKSLEELRVHGERWNVPYASDLHSLLHGIFLLETGGVRALTEVVDAGALRAAFDLAPVALRPAAARLMLELGERDLARAALEDLSGNDFTRFPRDLGYLASLASLAVLAIRLDDRPRAERLYTLLAPYPTHNTPNSVLLYEGSVSHFLGMLAAHLGRREEAATHFEAALAMNERIGQRPQLARTRAEYACLLRDGDAESS